MIRAIFQSELKYSVLCNSKLGEGKSVRRHTLQFLIITLCLSVILLVSPTAVASVGWTRTYQWENMDILTPTSVVQTLDGGYATVITGMLRRVDNIGYEGHFATSYELQILKTDSNGGVQWKRSYSTVDDPNHVTPTIYTYADHYVIVQTADQGYVVAGGYQQFWLFKVNSQGSVLWSQIYSLNDESSGYGQFYSLIQTSDSGFALAGSVDTIEGGKDFWLIKTNSVGVAQWNHTYNSGTYTDSSGYVNPCEDIAKCVIQTSDGGYALVGSISLFRASTSSLVYSAWVVKTDAQGKQLWNRGYDLLNDQGYEYIIIQTRDFGYAVAGTQNGDFCLFKTSSTNQLQWSKIYGDPQDDIPCSLVQLEDGGFAIAGIWTPNNITKLRSTLGLVRTDSSGQTLWIRNYTAREDSATFSFSTDIAKAMIRTSDGCYALIGSTMFDYETHQDVFFVKTETLEQSPQITPNPTPAASESLTTETPAQTIQPSVDSTQSAQNPTPSNGGISEGTSNPNILQISSQETPLLIVGAVIVAVIVGAVLVVVRVKRKRLSSSP
jgi:hypothetical protein